jgi:hypothetical protein
MQNAGPWNGVPVKMQDWHRSLLKLRFRRWPEAVGQPLERFLRYHTPGGPNT